MQRRARRHRKLEPAVAAGALVESRSRPEFAAVTARQCNRPPITTRGTNPACRPNHSLKKCATARLVAEGRDHVFDRMNRGKCYEKGCRHREPSKSWKFHIRTQNQRFSGNLLSLGDKRRVYWRTKREVPPCRSYFSPAASTSLRRKNYSFCPATRDGRSPVNEVWEAATHGPTDWRSTSGPSILIVIGRIVLLCTARSINNSAARRPIS